MNRVESLAKPCPTSRRPQASCIGPICTQATSFALQTHTNQVLCGLETRPRKGWRSGRNMKELGLLISGFRIVVKGGTHSPLYASVLMAMTRSWHSSPPSSNGCNISSRPAGSDPFAPRDRPTPHSIKLTSTNRL